MKQLCRWWCVSVVVIAASCGDPRMPQHADGGIAGDASDAATSDGESSSVGLELIAGDIGGPGNVDATGIAARFQIPLGVAIDSTGTVYVADTGNSTIRRITPAGVVTTLAGTAGMPGSADGAGAAARFDHPAGMAVDGAGNVYVADEANHTIRKITATGVVTTLAGTAGVSGSADGTRADARFNLPTGLAVDCTGNVYVADWNNGTVRKITGAGVVTTLAGTAGMLGSTDGTGTAARFYGPAGVAVDAAGTLYVADLRANNIRKITGADRVVTTLAGTAGIDGSVDDTGAAAQFSGPFGVAVDGAGTVYVADSANHTIRKITAAGVVTTLAGAAGGVGSADGMGGAARFARPSDVAVDSAGNVYVSDADNSTIRKVTTTGVATTVAGAAPMRGSMTEDGTGAAARFVLPIAAAVDNAGNMYVAEWYSNNLRKVTPAGVVTTLVDARGAAAEFDGPRGVGADSTGNVYVAAFATIAKVTAAGMVTTLAGIPLMPGSVNGTGAGARFIFPTGVAVDSTGNVYVTDPGDCTLRKVTPDGVATTLAGTSRLCEAADGVGADARFRGPRSAAVDAAGNIYVADDDTIRKVTPAGVTTTLAGTANTPGSADGAGAAARFNAPSGVAVNGAGNVYVADWHNNTIRKVTPDGTTTTIAGMTGVIGTLLGATPRFVGPRCLAIAGDSLIICDNDAILRLRHGAR